MNEPKKKSTPAFGFREIVVLVCLVGFFAWAAIPHFIKARSTATVSSCINNLRQIDAAANQFALENHLTNGDRIHFPNDLTPYIKLNVNSSIPGCPQGGIYSLSKVGDPPICSLGSTITPPHVLP
jgi:hypothetical protein